MKQNNSLTTKIVVMTALLTAMAVIINFFKVDIPIAGAPVMRVSFAGPFVKLVAILFGPLYGGISSGLLDFLSYIVKPSGGYILPILFTAILNGILTGILWNAFKKFNTNTFKQVYILFFAVIGLVGIINFISKTFLPQSYLGAFIISIGSKANYAAEGFIIASLIGVLLFLLLRFIFKSNLEMYLKIAICIGIPNLIVTTINTYILKLFIPVLSDKAFMILWIPRLLEEIFMLPIKTYLVILLMNIYQTVAKKIPNSL